MKRLIILSIGAAMLGGMAGAAVAAVPAKDFVMKAGASDLYEEQSSKLVLGSTTDPKIKSFANMMIVDHMKTTAGVKAAVKANGMAPKPPMLDAKQTGMITALKGASGKARDTLYLEQQKAAHQEALALMSDYAASGDNAPLKHAASTALPIVKHHIALLDTMGR